MGVTLTAPGALWLLAVVPAVWLALRWGRTNFNPRQRVLQAIVRSALLAALALALARPVISLGSSRLSVVYVVDTLVQRRQQVGDRRGGAHRRAQPGTRAGAFPRRGLW